MRRLHPGVVSRPSGLPRPVNGSGTTSRHSHSSETTTVTTKYISPEEMKTKPLSATSRTNGSTTATRPSSGLVKSTTNGTATRNAAPTVGRTNVSSTRTSTSTRTLPTSDPNKVVQKTTQVTSSKPAPNRTVRTTVTTLTTTPRVKNSTPSSRPSQPLFNVTNHTPLTAKTTTYKLPSSLNGPKVKMSSTTLVTRKVVVKAPPPEERPLDPGLVRCSICKRGFLPERLDKHMTACQKVASRPTKVFDPTKMRTQGTEQELYIRRGMHKKAIPEKKANWRAKHEEFINNVRQAKLVQDHLAKGGKLSDLPPPKPSENPDYVQCPHCKRKFNEGAAERHIPKCANILSNKKPPPKR